MLAHIHCTLHSNLLLTNVLQRSSLRSSSSDNDGVLHSIVLLKRLHQLGNSRTLLAHSNVDAVQLLRLVIAVVPPLLVEHGIEGDGRLSGLTITDDQLTLATSDRHHGVDGFEAGLHGLVDGAAGQDTGGFDLSTAALGGLDGALAVDGLAEGIDDAAEHGFADCDFDLEDVLVVEDE